MYIIALMVNKHIYHIFFYNLSLNYIIQGISMSNTNALVLTINNEDLVLMEAFEKSDFVFGFSYPEYIHSELYMVFNVDTRQVTLSKNPLGELISLNDFAKTYLV